MAAIPTAPKPQTNDAAPAQGTESAPAFGRILAATASPAADERRPSHDSEPADQAHEAPANRAGERDSITKAAPSVAMAVESLIARLAGTASNDPGKAVSGNAAPSSDFANEPDSPDPSLQAILSQQLPQAPGEIKKPGLSQHSKDGNDGADGGSEAASDSRSAPGDNPNSVTALDEAGFPTDAGNKATSDPPADGSSVGQSSPSAGKAKPDHKNRKGDKNDPAGTAGSPAEIPGIALIPAAAPASAAPGPDVKATAANNTQATASVGPDQKPAQAGNGATPAPAAGKASSPGVSTTSSATVPTPANANDPPPSPVAALAAQKGAGKTSNATSADKAPLPSPAPAPPVPGIPSLLPAQQPQVANAPSLAPGAVQNNAGPAVSQHIEIVPGQANIASLALDIAARSQSGAKEFSIRMDPPDLGHVEVRLSIDQSGQAQASLAADQPRTLDLLRSDAPQLAQALRNAGLNVGQNALNFSLRGQDRQNAQSGPAPRRPSRPLAAVSAIGAVQSGANYHGPANGRLDIRV